MEKLPSFAYSIVDELVQSLPIQDHLDLHYLIFKLSSITLPRLCIRMVIAPSQYRLITYRLQIAVSLFTKVRKINNPSTFLLPGLAVLSLRLEEIKHCASMYAGGETLGVEAHEIAALEFGVATNVKRYDDVLPLYGLVYSVLRLDSFAIFTWRLQRLNNGEWGR